MTEFYTPLAVGTQAAIPANQGLWGPSSGAAAQPNFRAQVLADQPAATILEVTMGSNYATGGANAVVKFDTVVNDTDSGYSAGTGLYTVATGKAGYYGISLSAQSGTSTSVLVYKNGSNVVRLGDLSSNVYGSSAYTLKLAAGDTVGIYAGTSSTWNGGSPGPCQMSIWLIGR